jgi:hypothetical protein
MTATWSRRGEVEKEKEDSVALDTEGQRFTQVSYRDALQRASRKVTESESKYRDDVITPESQGQTVLADLGVVGVIKVKVVVNDIFSTDRQRSSLKEPFSTSPPPREDS